MRASPPRQVMSAAPPPIETSRATRSPPPPAVRAGGASNALEELLRLVRDGFGLHLGWRCLTRRRAARRAIVHSATLAGRLGQLRSCRW